MMRTPPNTSLFPYTTLFRSDSRDPKSPTPFLSANDRSRWATIRSLGDGGTYVIDDIIFDAKGNRVRGWHTIDRKSTRLNSSHPSISYAVFCLKKKRYSLMLM